MSVTYVSVNGMQCELYCVHLTVSPALHVVDLLLQNYHLGLRKSKVSCQELHSKHMSNVLADYFWREERSLPGADLHPGHRHQQIFCRCDARQLTMLNSWPPHLSATYKLTSKLTYMLTHKLTYKLTTDFCEWLEPNDLQLRCA